MTQTDQKPIYVRKAELAKMLGVSPRNIDKWIAKRMIPVIATSPRLHLFDVEAVRHQTNWGVLSNSCLTFHLPEK